jgi:IS5 family transposase
MNIRQGCVFSFEDAIKMQPRSRLEIILATLDFKVIFEALSKNAAIIFGNPWSGNSVTFWMPQIYCNIK